MTTLAEFAEEMRPYHNQICMLYDTDLVRLVGVAQDEIDLYYIVRSVRPDEAGRRDTFCTAVGHCYSLKSHLPAERYAQTEAHFTRSGAGPSETFAIVNETAGERYIPQNESRT